MLKTLRVQLNAPAPELVHQLRNLGEAIWEVLKHDFDISLPEIDASTTQFHLRGIHERDLRALEAKVRTLVEKNHMGKVVTVSEVNREDDQNG
jgi:hypothetical protein